MASEIERLTRWTIGDNGRAEENPGGMFARHTDVLAADAAIEERHARELAEARNRYLEPMEPTAHARQCAQMMAQADSSFAERLAQAAQSLGPVELQNLLSEAARRLASGAQAMKRTIRIEIDADEETCKGDCAGLCYNVEDEESVCAIFRSKPLKTSYITGASFRCHGCKAAEAREAHHAPEAQPTGGKTP